VIFFSVQLGLLDQICQECACLIVLGEVGELEGRCLSCFEGKNVTHVILSRSGKKHRHFIYWPFGILKFVLINIDNRAYNIQLVDQMS